MIILLEFVFECIVKEKEVSHIVWLLPAWLRYRRRYFQYDLCLENEAILLSTGCKSPVDCIINLTNFHLGKEYFSLLFTDRYGLSQEARYNVVHSKSIKMNPSEAVLCTEVIDIILLKNSRKKSLESRSF